MSSNPSSQDETVWSLVQKSSKTQCSQTKEEIRQIYGSVADLYHQCRPKYPESLIDTAIQQSPVLLRKIEKMKKKTSDNDKSDENPSVMPKILEIGCGPGTLTLPLLKRREEQFHITAIDPGTAMIEKAKQVCSADDFADYVEFQNVAFKDFQPPSENAKFDAIVAASSLHWALAEDNDNSKMIQKLYDLLDYESSKDTPSLLLFWNFPPEPSSTEILNKIADALGRPKPFYFGNGNIVDHVRRLENLVLKPIENSGNFSKFSTHEESLQETWTIRRYIGYLQTLSNYIAMEDSEKKEFFDTVETIFQEECNTDEGTIETTRKSILNVSYAIKK